MWLLWLLWPTPASAHVQWFVTEPAGSFAPFSIFEWIVGFIFLTIGLAIFSYLTPLDTKLWQRLQLPQWAYQYVPIIIWLIAAGFAVWGYHEELVLGYGGLIAYAVLRKRRHQLGLTLLAVGTGLAFTEAALAEKLLHPEYSATFLTLYDWNFINNLGVTWFNDRWFILLAGMVEAGLGLALAIGLAPRLTIVLLSMVCVITAVLLGITEVIGHISIVMAFLIYLIDTTKLNALNPLRSTRT